MSSLSRDWVWMAVPKERGGRGILPTPLLPASIWPRRRFHFAILSTFSMQWRFSFEPLQFACINQLCLQMPPCVSAVCHWVHRGEEREQGGGVYHRLQSCLQLQLLFDNMCGFISFTCQQWIRGLFDYCAPRFHFLSARWLSASYHSRFRHSSSVDTKKVTTHTHAHSFTTMSARPRMMTNTCSEQKDSQAA